MEIGDIVYRKDMPQFKFKIICVNASWLNFWDVEPLIEYRGFGSWKNITMIPKDDERWVAQ